MKKRTGEYTPGKTQGVERCWVLIGWQDGELTWRFRRRSQSSGEAASVEANWEWALRREERYGDVVGFFHTHPHGDPQPSSRDIRTMRAWRSAFGKPLLCLIAAGKVLNGYVFADDDCQAVEVENIIKGERGWYTARAGG
jgi:proteasome lid subunit RPN8/RPN11